MKKIIIAIIVIVLISFLGFVKYNINSQQVVVLSYHNIIPDDVQKNEEEYETLTVSEFEKEMQYLKENNYKTITANELYEWKQGNIEIPEKSVLITFDDGYYSFKYLIEPILEKYEFNAICFVIGNSVTEKTPTYNASKNEMIGKDEIENHIKNVEYGSHTYGLHYLNESGEKAVRLLNKDELKKDTEQFDSLVFKAEYLAYPYYTYTNEYIDVLKESNYKLAFCRRRGNGNKRCK